ncbi:low affinity immunoglobulin epsilon Fc receptor-like [Pecten maximus]|uniref:low affinity immunoglobulin epsilon Fc receptor-like n=1 Tax=Pecten maximus TaxID=6579 RepID=UPI0014586227|nr:low affinity immunoglobulin epsilon Fc receptor-like [Pecten maximus]
MIMFNAVFYRPILTLIFVLKSFSLVDGHDMCASNAHVDMESNRNYKSFMHLDTIGVLQCMKVCKRYKLCEKIHHNREQLTCDLMMTNTEASKASNMTSLLDAQSVQIDSSNCSRNSCSETEVCVERRDGSHICLDQDVPEVCPAAVWVPFNGKCYFFPSSRMTADEGMVFCNSINATLLRVDSTEENTFLISEMRKRAMGHIWLAANYRAVEGEWVWGPGDVVLNALWNPNEPSYGSDGACSVLEEDTGGWLALFCKHYSIYAVCEVR